VPVLSDVDVNIFQFNRSMNPKWTIFELCQYGIQWAIHTLGSRDVNAGQTMPQAVSGRPLPTGSRVRSHFSPCGICGVRRGIGTRLSPSPSVFPSKYHSTNSLLILLLSEGQAGNVWYTPPTRNGVSEIGKRWVETPFTVKYRMWQ
jgi:hypothetical protein